MTHATRQKKLQPECGIKFLVKWININDFFLSTNSVLSIQEWFFPTDTKTTPICMKTNLTIIFGCHIKYSIESIKKQNVQLLIKTMSKVAKHKSILRGGY